MILLTSTSDLVQVVTSASQAIHAYACFVDQATGPTFTPGRTNTPVIGTPTTTTIVAGPGSSGIQRNVKYISLYNAGSAVNTVTVQSTDGTTLLTHKSVALQPGYSLEYDDLSGWKSLDTNGSLVQTVVGGVGRFLKTTVIQTGTTTFTSGPSTTSIRARLQASGGSGGGSPAVTSEAGGGGSSGSYAEWVVAVTPNTAYTCAVGASVNGTSGSAGTNGNNTTLTVGGVTCTANAGLAGPVGTTTSSLGAAAPAISTNGTVNVSGQPGDSGRFGTATTAGSGGNGGSSIFGGGGLGRTGTQGAGAAAITGAWGAGGGGAWSTGTVETGGASAAGILIIDEYS